MIGSQHRSCNPDGRGAVSSEIVAGLAIFNIETQLLVFHPPSGSLLSGLTDYTAEMSI